MGARLSRVYESRDITRIFATLFVSNPLRHSVRWDDGSSRFPGVAEGHHEVSGPSGSDGTQGFHFQILTGKRKLQTVAEDLSA
jgi:hypothetical protein